MSIRNDPQLRFIQQILDTIETLRLASAKNAERLLEINQLLSSYSERGFVGQDESLALKQERSIRIKQDLRDHLEITAYSISWDHLLPEDQKILKTFHQMNLTREEAVAILCNDLNRSEATVWTRYRRALKRLNDYYRISVFE